MLPVDGTGNGQSGDTNNAGTNTSILDQGSKGATNTPFALSKEVWGEINPQFPEGTEDGIKNEASLKSFVGPDGKFNQANLIKSYVHAQKTMGKDKVVVPREDGPDAEWDEFWGKLGYTKDASKYTLPTFEGDKDSKLSPEFKESFKKFAHDNKMPPKLADKFHKFFKESTEGSLAKHEEARVANFTKSLEALKSEWGTAFERKINAASVLVRENGGEEFKKYLTDAGYLGDHQIVKWMANLSEKIYGEDKLGSEGARNQGFVTRDEALNQINDLMKDPKGAYWNNNDSGHALAIDKVYKLRQIVSGAKE
jgi:hypothetical protein